jgi:FtsP/CotA-like multicopper oxidase with cupredoxin domain
MHSIRPVAAVALVSLCVLTMTGLRRTLTRTTPELSAKNHALSLTLHAAIAGDGKNSFYFNGQPNAPTLRLSPGDQLEITYINDLPTKPQESCAISPCMDMTNLHFHRLEISLQAPQDNVLDMMAMSGDTHHYVIEIPPDHPPRLSWYHTHSHGESHGQALDGTSGAIVIEGMDHYLPELRNLQSRFSSYVASPSNKLATPRLSCVALRVRVPG